MEVKIDKTIRSMLIPLALTQFVASFAASNMNVAINDIAKDLGTDVSGVQTAITLFTLTMAALMIPGSKLTDIWGRKFCLRLGLLVYGVGALIACVVPGPGDLGSRLFIIRRGWLCADDPPRLHPDHGVLKRSGVARQGFRRDQWYGRDRRRCWTADWRFDHDCDQLAGFFHLAGFDCRGDHFVMAGE